MQVTLEIYSPCSLGEDPGIVEELTKECCPSPLPDELWSYIFKRLDASALQMVVCVCKKWNNLTVGTIREEREQRIQKLVLPLLGHFPSSPSLNQCLHGLIDSRLIIESKNLREIHKNYLNQEDQLLNNVAKIEAEGVLKLKEVFKNLDHPVYIHFIELADLYVELEQTRQLGASRQKLQKLKELSLAFLHRERLAKGMEVVHAIMVEPFSVFLSSASSIKESEIAPIMDLLVEKRLFNRVFTLVQRNPEQKEGLLKNLIFKCLDRVDSNHPSQKCFLDEAVKALLLINNNKVQDPLIARLITKMWEIKEKDSAVQFIHSLKHSKQKGLGLETLFKQMEIDIEAGVAVVKEVYAKWETKSSVEVLAQTEVLRAIANKLKGGQHYDEALEVAQLIQQSIYREPLIQEISKLIK
ncbi:F-box-like domain-containing protein [Candidatus Protochlamydia phocaeensis]|uniref:F-box-like domain-containing protein n=1 Tax=Candidatus Protochlamydia phocaeensis TaxID=1414722 RepID=UPI000838F989|nr:F-box-like domain-containing protein [Candidatus Protochlamydia phocaeensis]